MPDQLRNVFTARGVVTHVDRAYTTKKGNVVANVAYDLSDLGHGCSHSALVIYDGPYADEARALSVGDVCEFQFCVVGFYDGPGTQATCMLNGGHVKVVHSAADLAASAEKAKRAEVDALLKELKR